MKVFKLIALSASSLALALGFLLPLVRTTAAENESPIPPVIQSGFVFFEKQHPEQGLDAWKAGGLVGELFPLVANGEYFKQAERTLGKYESYEWIATKKVGQSSRVIYLSINYSRGAVFARFLMYRAAKSWVVQSMDFNTRPEALMPWLTYEDRAPE